ncbi:signal peptidase II [Stakelama tenebrarum]|uniref:Lipoprotein signal peptidase n=1 Tax=Stakelama tenebrarum TaxID=2711215 RepID=A0A6G6Y0E5_9SPHN|nr:signal peptidase II [Sphingosinithalassobacter tenebrarum]QIG78414.1 signal peptidase II [Sphingosinithalassobacter tenebrarum]
MNVSRGIGLATAVLIFVVDQISKLVVIGLLGVDIALVQERLARNMDIGDLGYLQRLLPFFDLRFVPNVGVSLGLLEANNDAMRWALVMLTGAIAIGVAIWMWREKKIWDIVALGMVLGGALGNILDRSRLGFVVDFADLHFGTWRPFLVFNVADAAITIGVVILLFRALFVRDKDVVERP